MRSLRFILASIVLLGCQAGEPQTPPSSATAPAPTAQTKAPRVFGAPLGNAPKVELQDIAKEPTRFVDKTIQVEGTVSAVCQSQGCWMQIGKPGERAHIKMAGHKFLVPRDSAGKKARVEGKVLAAKVDACESADSCREKAERASGIQANIEMEATGVELIE